MSLNNTDDSNLLKLLNEKICIGNKLLEQLDVYSQINGITKLKKNIKRELQFLTKKKSNDLIRSENIQCTNLHHFHAVYQTIAQLKDSVNEIGKVFLINNKKLSVDIVCENGYVWIKVIARNPKGLEQALEGDTNYGTRSIIDQANEFLMCSKLYPICYRQPKIIFHFAQGVTENITTELNSLGISVSTINNLSSVLENLKKLLEEELNNEFRTNKLNLDVSTLIAYVSNLTNGRHKFRFKEPILTQQAEWEAARPIKPILDELFADRELYCCQTAHNDFKNIIDTVGGNEEKRRSNELLSRLTVLPDDFETSQHAPLQKLEIYGKIKERSRLIFEFGARIQAITVSANEGFVRSAKQQGIEFATFIHESRALTEQKENTAVPTE